MDKTDCRLLSHMQGDASLSVGELANRIGISKSACWRRIQKMEDDRGILIGASAVSLHVPVDSWAIAGRILSSPGNTQTSAASANPNTNAINVTRSMGMLPEGYFINRRFTDTNSYFIKTDVPNGTKMFVRSPLQTKMEPDFDTGNLRFKARERYSFGVSDWRGFFGSAGT